METINAAIYTEYTTLYYNTFAGKKKRSEGVGINVYSVIR